MVQDLERDLRAKLSGRLPGLAAQLALSPRPRYGWKPGYLPPDCRTAAGLLLVYPAADSPHVVLTVRASELPHHAGQVSLPGGAVERGETIEEAALREAEEEVGIRPAAVRVLGRLSPLHIPVSGFALHAVVGVTDGRPPLRPEPGEVERILEVPVDTFRDASLLGRFTREYRGRPYEVPFFGLGPDRLWGATAMVLSEFLWLLGIRLDPWGDGGGAG